jgi:hypothetical protein
MHNPHIAELFHDECDQPIPVRYCYAGQFDGHDRWMVELPAGTVVKNASLVVLRDVLDPAHVVGVVTSP